MEFKQGLNFKISYFLALLAIAPLLSMSPVDAENRLRHTVSHQRQYVSKMQVGVSVPAIARLVTVRIIASQGTGSGVIIKRKGQTYTVLTCNHVVDDTQHNSYTVLTADGLTHSGQWLRSAVFGNTDLALVQFTSNQPYRVAAVGAFKDLSIGNMVYASGFPSWQSTNSNAVDDTRNWGMRAFRITRGKVAMLPKKSLQEGYQIGYTNDVEQGMSGGPVLNQSGKLVGINGGLKHPLQGIVAFTFADGTVPSQKIFQQMEALSWAIPIATFQSVAEKP
jgi:S1-C subfamily serine protease